MRSIAEAAIPQSATVVLLPKNGGLCGQLPRARDLLAVSDDVQEYAVRGEDVPYIAGELSRLGRRVVALTGDDLLDEWLARGNALSGRLVRSRILWSDPEAIFGAPALCLIGRSSETLRGGAPLRVAICARYAQLAQRFLSGLRRCGLTLETFDIQGTVENCVTSGVADLAVDIVVTGRTIRKADLRVLRVIATSDLAVLESR